MVDEGDGDLSSGHEALKESMCGKEVALPLSATAPRVVVSFVEDERTEGASRVDDLAEYIAENGLGSFCDVRELQFVCEGEVVSVSDGFDCSRKPIGVCGPDCGCHEVTTESPLGTCFVNEVHDAFRGRWKDDFRGLHAGLQLLARYDDDSRVGGLHLCTLLHADPHPLGRLGAHLS